MASTMSTTHLPPLGAHERREIGRELQATLVELVDLSLVGKQLHWSVVGSACSGRLHQQLDELVDSWRELGDTVAERAVAIGFWPDGQAEAIAAGSASLPASSPERSRATPSCANLPGAWPRRASGRPWPHGSAGRAGRGITGRPDRGRPRARAAAVDGPCPARRRETSDAASGTPAAGLRRPPVATSTRSG